MSYPILPDNKMANFQWDSKDLKYTHSTKGSGAYVNVTWNDENFKVSILIKDSNIKDSELKKILRKQIDTTILLMNRYMTPKIESLSYNSENHMVKKRYRNTSKSQEKKFEPDKLEKEKQKANNKGKTDKNWNRIQRIVNTQKLYKILTDNKSKSDKSNKQENLLELNTTTEISRKGQAVTEKKERKVESKKEKNFENVHEKKKVEFLENEEETKTPQEDLLIAYQLLEEAKESIEKDNNAFAIDKENSAEDTLEAIEEVVQEIKEL